MIRLVTETHNLHNLEGAYSQLRAEYTDYISLRQKLISENLSFLSIHDSRNEDSLDFLLDVSGELTKFMWLRSSFLSNLEINLGIKDEPKTRFALHVSLKAQKSFSEFLLYFEIE